MQYFKKLYKRYRKTSRGLVNQSKKYLTERQCILVLAFLIGLAGAGAALILKFLVQTYQHFLFSTYDGGFRYLYFIYPAVGIFLTGLFVRYIIKDDIGHGVSKILYAISQRRSFIKRHNVVSSVLASSMTIGFGGSVGAEAPIVLTGAAIGSNLGRFFRMNQHALMVLLGCGAAAGIAGIFKAPISGLVFIFEVLMLDLTAYSIMPLLVSAITAASVAFFFEGSTPMFSFTDTMQFTVKYIPYVIILGIVCGLVSFYFTRCTFWMEKRFQKIRSQWKKFIVGGSLLCILIFFFPPLYGQGYDSIRHIYDGEYSQLVWGSPFYHWINNSFLFCLFCFLIIGTKVFATAATNGGGGCGGIFAPSLFLGNMVGFLYAFILNEGGWTLYLPEKSFAVMGMAAIMSGVMYAPMLGVFLSTELTGRFDLFLPLLIASTLSYGTMRIFGSYSIYTYRLALNGQLITHHKDKAVLCLMKLNSFIETDYQIVSPTMTFGELVKIISKAKHNTFPVCDTEKRFLGIITLDEVRKFMFQTELYDKIIVNDILVKPIDEVHLSMDMIEVMRLFEITDSPNFPIIDNGKYIGMISKNHVLTSYRKILKHFSEE